MDFLILLIIGALVLGLIFYVRQSPTENTTPALKLKLQAYQTRREARQAMQEASDAHIQQVLTLLQQQRKDTQ